MPEAMAESLEPLPAVDSLYDYRSGFEEVPNWLPYNQGDVFDEVDVPGIVNHSGAVMLFMHPCTMRDARGIREFVTVVSVREQSAKKILDSSFWERHYKAMPLPDLKGDGHSTHYGDLMTVNTIASSAIPRSKRIAQLSLVGRLHFLHRTIFHLTRFAPSTSELERATRAVERELQQQADWLESASGGVALTSEKIDSIEHSFQNYLDVAWVARAGEPQPLARTLREGLHAADSSQAVRRIQRDIAEGLPKQSESSGG
ncbi:hypothetical protein ACTWP6_29550 [Mycobacterium sp. 4D054]|uniref:hypothetical protein n=1 Tax=Mycobacterium sp. 4D054 TaxID=3457440 RepID=UPI003FD23039